MVKVAGPQRLCGIAMAIREIGRLVQATNLTGGEDVTVWKSSFADTENLQCDFSTSFLACFFLRVGCLPGENASRTKHSALQGG
jgi:hypothetical protein